MTNRKQWVADTLEKCKQYGYRTTPVFEDGVTKPFAKGQDYKNVMDYKGCSHIGLILDDCVLVDYDGNKDHEGMMSVDELGMLIDDMGVMPTPVQNRGEDSIHWLYKRPDNYEGAASRDGWMLGVDIKTSNQLMHIKIDKDLNLVSKDELEPCPQVLIDALGEKKAVTRQQDCDDELGDFAGMIGIGNVTEEEANDDLAKLDPDMVHDDWVKVGLGLHSALPTTGLDIWKAWSMGSDKYEEGICELKWRSFKVGGGVTYATIKHMVKAVEWEKNRQGLEKMKESIAKADEKELEMSVYKSIRKSDIDDYERDILANLISMRVKELTGVKPKIALIRGKIKPEARGELVLEDEAPAWCRYWIYINSSGEFVNKRDMMPRSQQAFNMECGKYIPKGENGSKQSAAKFVADGGFVRTVMTKAYLPMLDDVICKYNGYEVFNTYDRLRAPKPADTYTEDGLKACEIVSNHLKLLCNNVDEHHKILMQWVAHNVQYKGKKILWSPLFQSIEGVGKSWFHTLFNVLLGEANVTTVSPSQVTSDFNGWATGRCVNILNEVRIKGHNRYDAVNALKPLITDPQIMINEKGQPAYQTLNTSNYICFTNYRDAIPMDEDSRRWWVIFIEIFKLEEIGAITGIEKEVYLDNIFKAIREHGDEILKMFLEYEITDAFLGLKQAPDTPYKQMMVATENSNDDFYDTMKELIKRGGDRFNEEVIVITNLVEALRNEFNAFDNPDYEVANTINSKSCSIGLKKLGYSKNAQARYRGESLRVWTRRHLTKEQIESHLFKDEI
jgi:hypothetical protein